VFEAVGKPETWGLAVAAATPGGVVVFVGGCPRGTEAVLPTAPIHYDELDLRGTFHHSYAEVDRALVLLADGVVDWRALAGDTIALGELPRALTAPPGGPARKWVVDPRL
jgi:L-iditol 2-dehydrogenase